MLYEHCALDLLGERAAKSSVTLPIKHRRNGNLIKNIAIGHYFPCMHAFSQFFPSYCTITVSYLYDISYYDIIMLCNVNMNDSHSFCKLCLCSTTIMFSFIMYYLLRPHSS